MKPPLVIGIGNRWRGDDAAGPMVLDALRQLVPVGIDLLDSPGDNLSLINAWTGRERVFLIDACSADDLAPGTVVTIDNALVDGSALARMRHPASTHLLDVGQAIAMSKVLANAPQRLTIYGIAASEFEAGDRPCDAVLAAVNTLSRELASLLTTLRPGATRPANRRQR
ncbi:MAG: hydrogenase maturation protease [Gammaproteobacteria bacterium]|nr:hydrogenase maturation protease [Gammaproteobacteria bacterium]